MALVVFSSEQQRLTGEGSVEVSAGNYRDLVAELLARYPKLDAEEMSRMAMVLDGVIIHDPLLEDIPAGSEVHFLHFVRGG